MLSRLFCGYCLVNLGMLTLSYLLFVDLDQIQSRCSSSRKMQQEAAFEHLKELLASIKMELDPGFASFSGREKVFKVRGQRDRRVRIGKWFTFKAPVKENLQETQ